MTLLVSQVFIGLSEHYSCSAVAYQMAPTCSKQMNLLPCTLHRYPINFVLGHCIAAAPDGLCALDTTYFVPSSIL